jgi:capsular exopolysaccharide synthesis family protein
MKGWKAFGVTSSVANEGKTLCCTKVAASMASTKRKKVLLVDADNRKADLSRGMGIAGLPGLTDFLLGTASLTDVIRKTSLNGLFTVSSGGDVPVPADLLAGERFRFFLEEARSVFDMLFLDLPPVISVSDAMAVRDRLDGFIFIYRFGFTPITLFQQASEEIGEKKILGVVLNCAEPKSEKYYKNYYGKYYVSSKPGGKEEQE